MTARASARATDAVAPLSEAVVRLTRASHSMRTHLVTRDPDPRDARARIVKFTTAGLAWLQAFREAVAQAEREFRSEVGADVATVVAIGLEAYAGAPPN